MLLNKRKPLLRAFKRVTVTALFVGLALLLMKVGGYDPPLSKLASRIDSTAIKEPFRTIYPLDGSDSPLSFSVRRISKGNAYEGPEYAAVIRSIDPKKDDYKLYCKSVIAEIVRLAKTNRIKVRIYDSDLAFKLGEAEFGDTSSYDEGELAKVGNHMVARYEAYNDCGDDLAPTLEFFPDATNGFTSKESFTIGENPNKIVTTTRHAFYSIE